MSLQVLTYMMSIQLLSSDVSLSGWSSEMTTRSRYSHLMSTQIFTSDVSLIVSKISEASAKSLGIVYLSGWSSELTTRSRYSHLMSVHVLTSDVYPRY